MTTPVLFRAYMMDKDERGRIISKGYRLIVEDGVIILIESMLSAYARGSTGIAYFVAIFCKHHSCGGNFPVISNKKSSRHNSRQSSFCHINISTHTTYLLSITVCTLMLRQPR